MKRPHFGGISIFLRFGVFWGPGHLCFFRDPTTAKIPKNRIWGPVEAVSAKFSGDLKVAHGDSATVEPKKSRFWAVEAELWGKYRFARAPAVGPMGARGQKDLEKKTEIWPKITKNEKNRTYPQNVRNFVRNRVATFFFRFWTRFDPLLAILLVLGGAASIGEPDQKDLAKIWNLTENHQKRKKSNLPWKCA